MSQIYLNTAACGPIAKDVRDAGTALYESFATTPSIYAEHWRMNDEARIREAIAAFINVPAPNVAMIPNFSWAMNGVVQSLKGTEKVLLYRKDYPSLLEPFIINQFDIAWIDDTDDFTIDIEEIRRLIKEQHIDLLVISHVQWLSGHKLDLEAFGALCKEYNVNFILDATQSTGAMPIDVTALNIDVFISSNYKWMNAGFGTGIMYMSDAFLAMYPPVVGGHNSYKMQGDTWGYVPSVQSFEPGHPNMFGLTILERAIKSKIALGLAHIEAHNTSLTQLFLDQIKDLPVSIKGTYSTDNRASIVLVKDTDGLGDWIRQNNIIVTQRNGYLRVSMHYYNTEAEVTALSDCISSKKS